MLGDIKITVNYAPFSANVTVDSSASSISVLISNPLSDIIVTLGNMPLNGLPPGGLAGQVLTKVGTNDYESAWYDPSGGALTWEQVLTSGNTVTQMYVSQMTADSQYVNFVIPWNFGVGGAGRYTSWVDSNFVNPTSGRKDVVFAFHAYNWVVGGQAEIPGEAAYAFKCEQYYEADTTNLFEFHLPEIIDNAGTAHRPWSFYIHRGDGYTYLQSQIGSLSFRPNYDNTGASEWFGLGGGGYVGTAQMTLNSSFGTGGAAGDQSNFVRFQMFDGTGNAYTLFGSGGGFALITPGETTLNTGLLNLSRYIRFNQASYYGNVVNFETGFPRVEGSGEGYYFYDSGQNNLYAQFTGAYTWIYSSLHVIGNAPYGNLVFSTRAVDPTDTGDGKLWYDGTNFATYTSATKKTFVLSNRTISTTGPLSGGGNLSADRTLSIADAAADGATKGAAAFAAADFNSAAGVISIDYTNGQAASASLKGFLTSADWTTFNNKPSSTRAINTTAPLSGGGDLSADRTLSIANAAADGVTKGAAAFAAADFNSASGVISIDYVNGQAATTSQNGFLSSTDWTTFNSKQSALTFSTGLNNASGTITAKLSTGFAGGLTAIGGTGSGESLTLQSTTHATRGLINFGSAATSFFDEANNYLKIVANPGAAVSFQKGLYLQNTTPAAAGAQKWSPMLTLEGQGWNTGGSSSLPVSYTIFTAPQQGVISNNALIVYGHLNGSLVSNPITCVHNNNSNNSYTALNAGLTTNDAGISIDNTNGGAFFTIGRNNPSLGGGGVYMQITANGGVNTFANNSRNFFFSTNSGNVMTILASTGQIGINITPSGNGRLHVGAGGSTSPAKVGGVIFDHFADAGNTTTGETDLYTDTLPASILNTNGDTIRAQYGGITVAHATNTRRIRVYFGGTVIMDTTAVATTTAANWFIDVTVVRDSSTSVRCMATLSDNNTSNMRTSAYTTVTALTLTATQIIKVTGQSSSSTNDIVAKLSKVEYLSAL